MKPMRLLRRLPPRFAFWALVGVALLVSHDAIWLTQVGPGEALTSALRHGGHDYWGTASAILTAIGMGAAIWAAIRLVRLGRRPASGAPIERLSTRPYLRRVGGAWLRLFAVVAIGFVFQENVEHALMHGHRLGVGALLGPEYPLALPVLAAITLLAALLAAAFVTAERILLTRTRMTPRRLRAPRSLQRPMRRIALPGGIAARTPTGRGPPSLLVPI
ncbi:MAG: hypothetical protein M3Y40_00360 [Chloroflexota bacterium]|nr:hypothetical protein [Chloroflexota bacterium]